MAHKMIFYHPAPLSNHPQSGSQVRPIKMLEAFRSLGYDVYEITGTLNQRVQRISKLMEDLSRHHPPSYRFFYGESITAPPFVRDKTLSIGQALKDMSIFNRLYEQKIPLGLFYRDVHWKFDQYRNNVRLDKRLLSIPFFYYELYIYSRFLDYLFLPSIEMLKVIPFFEDKTHVIPLPPGCDNIQNTIERLNNRPSDSSQASLRLLYVGGIIPPMYDIRPVLDIVRRKTNIQLTISCRRQEWNSWKNLYESFLTPNIQIVHASEPELRSLYYQSDISLLFYAPHEYRRLAIPLKLFESLGYGVPMIASGDTEAAKFIQAECIGWVASSSDELGNLLTYLANNSAQIKTMRKNVYRVCAQHTWRQRAQQVADLLLRVQ